MDKKLEYLSPEVEEVILYPAEGVLSTVSTQGFTEDDAFDPSGFIIM